jgi:heme/copper-type cytochrome/quinol oxidase subunit 4
MHMPYVDERSRTMKLVLVLLTILVVGGAIYWAMASSD